VPLCGVPWRATLPPVDLELWPQAEGQPRCFTTIATWENKGKNIEFDGANYLWSKHTNFLRFLDLPRHRSDTCFEMAMLPPDTSVQRQVESAGWRLVDPRPVSADMANYQAFIAGSRGEFTVAKDIYVRPNSGWFSDRAVCYLAAGRPVVTMRTGFTSYCPAGRGVFDYATQEEALAAIDAVAAHYSAHSRAAREVAGDIFAAERVIDALLKEAGL
jgi:glycosyltransferase involved in cell wall biosynthesis